MSELFDPIQAAGPAAAATGDTAWLQAMLDAEAALARAQAETGVIPAEHADAIGAVCRAVLYDAAAIGTAATAIGNPAAPLVRALTERVGGEAARSVHRGATSQDIMDTAAMLIAHRALGALLDDVLACADTVAVLAEQHACTPQVGRTLLQQALPVTFGFTAAGWLSALDAAAANLEAVRTRRLAAQLGGAAGTLAALDEHGPQVLAVFARELNLAAPELPWHTDRTRIGELAAALGTAAGTVAKIARDITLLAQTEIGEVEEVADAAGGSSTLPHKRNPIAAVAAGAAAAQAPGSVANLLAAMAHEHQRAAGSWHAEWRPFNELLRAVGSAVHWLRISLSRLQIRPTRMRANLAATGGLLMAERVTTALTPRIGRLTAHDAVTYCARRAAAGDSFVELLAAHPDIGDHLSRQEIAALLDTSGYTGSATVFVDRALAAHDKTAAGHYRPPRTRGAVAVRSAEYGDPTGVPVVLINALGSDSRIWNPLLNQLTGNGFRVICHDTRGHGDSPTPAGPYGLNDFGGDILALLDRKGIRTAHLVGISLGGMTALWLARHAPHRVRGLVVCCTSARPGNTEMWMRRAAQARTEGMQNIADAGVERWFTPQWRAAHPDNTRRMRQLTADTPAAGYAACCETIARVDLLTDLPAITAPTLVLAGAQDPAFPPGHGRVIADRIPRADFEMIDGAAHLGIYEQPERFARAIIDHLGQIP